MAKILHHSIGDQWAEPVATFTVANVATDPTQITVTQQDSAQVETVLYTGATAALNSGTTPVAKTGTGVYKLSPGIALTTAGHWFVKFAGTAGVVATIEWETIVDPDQFSADAGIASYALVGLSETKDWLKHQNIDATDDLSLVRVINDISARFAEEADREFKVFGTNPLVRTFDVNERAIYRREVEVGDLSSFTLVRILDELGNVMATPSLSDCISLPRVRRTWDPIRAIRFTQNVIRLWAGYYPFVVEVTGNWGFPAVPGNVRQAVLDAVVSTMDRDVEDYKEDLASGASSGSGSAGKDDALPGAAMDVALSYRDELIG